MADLPSEEIAKKLNVEWIRKLGKGGYGEVFLALDLLTGQVSQSEEHGRDPSSKLTVHSHAPLSTSPSSQSSWPTPNVVRIIKRASWDDTFWICMEVRADSPAVSRR